MKGPSVGYQEEGTVLITLEPRPKLKRDGPEDGLEIKPQAGLGPVTDFRERQLRRIRRVMAPGAY
jgi:hypothetical protein